MSETQLLQIPVAAGDAPRLGLREKLPVSPDPRLPPVLLLHGATLGAALFDLPRPGYSLMAALTRAGRAVYASRSTIRPNSRCRFCWSAGFMTRYDELDMFFGPRQGRPRLNAQLISVVSGRPKTSIAVAVKQLQKKKLITRKTDIADSRRQVLHIAEAGRSLYKSILGRFMARETDMLAGLDAGERQELHRLFDKIIKTARTWAKPY
jgi:hypothetical protein